MPPTDLAIVLCHAAVDTLCASMSATSAVRHQVRSSRLAPAIRAASLNVRRLESLAFGHVARDWTRLAPYAVLRTSGPHLPVSDTLASSTVPALPKRVSNIARWIPSLLPPPAARSATLPALATAPAGFRTRGARIGIGRGLLHPPLPRRASFYVHRFPLSYT